MNDLVKACLHEPDRHTQTLKNYNEQSVQEIIAALKNVLREQDLKIPIEFDWVSIVLTDDLDFYNDSYLSYTNWDYPSDAGIEDTAFYTTAGFYLAENNTIYVNLTANGVEKPTSIIIHELTHIVSNVNYGHVDFEHENKALWKELKHLVLLQLGIVSKKTSILELSCHMWL